MKRFLSLAACGGWNDNQYKNVLVKEVAESSARRQMMETGECQLSSEFSATFGVVDIM